MSDPERAAEREPGLDATSSISAVQQLYDRWARYYDWNPVLELVRPARRRAVERMDLAEGDTVVDMGTGTGANLPLLRRAVGSTGHVIGIDISPEMLTQARARVRAGGWENVSLLQADVRDPPLEKPVDGILSAFVIVMYADPGQLIDTWASYLDGGSLANLYAGPSSRRYAPGVNPLLSLYLRVFEEGWNTAAQDTGPLDVLARRGDRAQGAIEQHASAVNHETLIFGLAHLDVGRVNAGANGSSG